MWSRSTRRTLNPASRARIRERLGLAGNADRDGVEVRLGDDVAARCGEPRRQRPGQPMHALGDGAQPLRSVIHGVHRSDHREQHLRGADVRGRLLAPDVLLAGLQRHAQRGAALRVDRNADDPPGGLALVRIAGRKERGMRPAEPHGNPEALRAADHDVRAERARRLDHARRQQIGGEDREALRGVHPFDDAGRVAQCSARPRVLDEHAEPVAPGSVAFERFVRIADRHVDSQGGGAGPDHRDGLRMAVGVDEELRRFRLRDPARHRHRFRRRRRLVEQRGVGDLHPGEIHDHLLEVEQGFEPSLAHLGLVGGVRGVPGRVFEHVAQHHRRGHGAVVAHADHRDERKVPVRHRAQGLHRLALGQRRVEGERLVVSNRCGDGAIEKVGEGRDADDFEHRRDVPGGGADVT